ncbi:hypothetical protein C1N83_25915 [Priestia aryabhattai]
MPDLSHTLVLITAGVNDPICPKEESEEVKEILENAHANVEIHWESFGHCLTKSEVDAASFWYQKHF